MQKNLQTHHIKNSECPKQKEYSKRGDRKMTLHLKENPNMINSRLKGSRKQWDNMKNNNNRTTAEQPRTLNPKILSLKMGMK